MPRPNQINLDQAAHCHGSNFNVSSSPNKHSYQSDQFLSTWSNWSIPHHLDKHKMKRSKPYESCFLDKTSPLDPRNVPSHNFQQTAASDTSGLRSSLPPPRMEQNHRRTLYWLAVPDSYICDEYFEFTFCFCSLCRISQLCYFHLLLFPITYISPPLASHCFLIYRSSQIIYYDMRHLHSHIFRCIALPF